MAQYAAKAKRSTDFRLGIRPELNVPAEIRKLDRGAVWGMDMYRAVRAGRIAPNFHINAVAGRGQNMRLLEVTGVGSFMLTEDDPELGRQFTPGREVETYSGIPELLEKTTYFLDNETAREEIARRGQERCLTDHSMERRAEWLDQILQDGLKNRSTAPPRPIRKPSLDDQIAAADALLARGDIAGAAQSAGALAQKHPANAKALTLLGRVAQAAGQPQRAAELFALARNQAGDAAPPAALKGIAPLQAAFPGVSFGHDVQCLGLGSTRIGQGSVVGDGTWINVCIRDNADRMIIGDFVLIGRRAVLSSGQRLEVGAFTIFGPNVYVASAEHQYQGNHLQPMMQTGIRDLGSLVIEENCWLGMNASAVGGFTIGRGSVVGANAVLRNSIPPFSIAVGAPARIVRMFNPVTEAWESVKSSADQERIEAARLEKPLPGRAEFLAQLKAANNGRPIPPIVAGRGEHMV
jgi:acetyltransferase-like isoleucine patch superfamily enzyme